jgi:hypothetical protein
MDKNNVSPQPTSHTRQTLARVNKACTSNIAKGKWTYELFKEVMDAM